MRTSHLLADQYPLVVIQVFYILYPRAWMFPQLWKVVSQHTLKLHRPLPELGLNIRHPLRGLKCWQLPIVTWSGSASISQHCSRDAMSKPTPGVHDTHSRWTDRYELWEVLIRYSLFSQNRSPTGWGSTGALLEMWAVSTGGVGGGSGEDASLLPTSLHLAPSIIFCLKFLKPAVCPCQTPN